MISCASEYRHEYQVIKNHPNTSYLCRSRFMRESFPPHRRGNMPFCAEMWSAISLLPYMAIGTASAKRANGKYTACVSIASTGRQLGSRIKFPSNFLKSGSETGTSPNFPFSPTETSNLMSISLWSSDKTTLNLQVVVSPIFLFSSTEPQNYSGSIFEG